MATSILANISARGTRADFQEAMATAPNVWMNHTKQVTSTTPDERYTWLGMLPIPRELISQRNIQGMRDFTFTQENQEFEMTFIIDQNTVEDDQHGTIQSRIREVAEVYATFKDSQFATLLIQGENSTDTYDGTSFHSTTRTIGASANIDNSNTTNTTTVNAPTTAEVKALIKLAKETMFRFEDDQGRTAYNAVAMNNVVVIIPPEYEQVFTEVIKSSIISNSDNPFFKDIFGFEVLAYLTDADNAVYINALGAERMPFLYQERTPLQVEVFNSPQQIAEEHGLKILTRQRYRFGYGEPRRSLRHDFT